MNREEKILEKIEKYEIINEEDIQEKVPKELLDNYQFVLEAAKKNPLILDYASERLKNDKVFVLNAMDIDVHYAYNAPSWMWEDESFKLNALQRIEDYERDDHNRY